MSENKGINNGVAITGVGTAVGTIAAAVAGTALAEPAAIGAGVGLAIWGTVELVKGLKKQISNRKLSKIPKVEL